MPHGAPAASGDFRFDWIISMPVYYRDESPASELDLDIDRKLAEFVLKRGLRLYAYHVRLVPGEIDRDLILYSNYPSPWIIRYWAEDYIQVDPLLALAQYSIMPIDWDDIDRSDSKVERLFEERLAHGIGPRGLTVPIRGAFGDFALFSVTSDEEISPWRERLSGLVRDVVMTAYETHSAAIDARLRELDHGTRPLSTRERQVLTLAGQGLPQKSVAYALEISESAVKLYLDTARQKLGAHNTAQAIAHAVSRHLIASPE